LNGTLRTAVLVVGGGPAGCAAAIRLAQLGHVTTLLERSKERPGADYGEALTPGVVGQLNFLGSDIAKIEHRFRFPGSEIKWQSSAWTFRVSPPDGATVVRTSLDSLLIATAECNGVRVMRPAAAAAAERHGNLWTVTTRTPEGHVNIEADFLIDASGRAGFLPSERSRGVPRTIALFGHWTGRDLPPIPRVEAGPTCWYWGSPIPGLWYTATIFIGHDDLPPRWDVAEFYRHSVERADLLDGSSAARLAGRVRARDASAYFDSKLIGDGFIKVGEAAMATDPLSSSGIQLAIQSGIAAGVTVNTLLLQPGSSEIAERFYRSMQGDAHERQAAWAATTYGECPQCHSTSFWRTRSAADPPPRSETTAVRVPLGDRAAKVSVSSEASVSFVPCAVGDFIEEREAVSHPGLHRPVAYVGGQPLCALLDEARRTPNVNALMNMLSARCGTDSAVEFADWMFGRGLLHVG
jgi:flavin-dependent dehydrogenase